MKPPGASALAQDHPTGLPDPDPGFLRNNLARVSMCSPYLLLVYNPTDLHWIPMACQIPTGMDEGHLPISPDWR